MKTVSVDAPKNPAGNDTASLPGRFPQPWDIDANGQQEAQSKVDEMADKGFRAQAVGVPSVARPGAPSVVTWVCRVMGWGLE